MAPGPRARGRISMTDDTEDYRLDLRTAEYRHVIMFTRDELEDARRRGLTTVAEFYAEKCRRQIEQFRRRMQEQMS